MPYASRKQLPLCCTKPLALQNQVGTAKRLALKPYIYVQALRCRPGAVTSRDTSPLYSTLPTPYHLRVAELGGYSSKAPQKPSARGSAKGRDPQTTTTERRAWPRGACACLP